MPPISRYSIISALLSLINTILSIICVSLQDPVDPGELCPGPSGGITQYQIKFQTGSSMATEVLNIAKCTSGRCSHTFEPSSNPPSSYDSVSVAAVNVVGVGAARTCTAQTISELRY